MKGETYTNFSSSAFAIARNDSPQLLLLLLLQTSKM
jgi:hypothetical protein